MYTIDVFNQTGKKVDTVKVNSDIFNDDALNLTAIADYIRLQNANQRLSTAMTKTRWMIHGSGKKLYKQKGTGSARAGDKKSPTRKKGWVVFGPSTARNFELDLPKKVRRKVVAGLLSNKMKEGVVVGLDKFSFDTIKTKNAVGVLDSLKLSDNKVLVVVSEKDELLIKSFHNIPKIKVLLASYMNPRDLLNHTNIILVANAMDVLEKNLAI